MTNLKSPTFESEQYFILKKNYFAETLGKIERILKKDQFINKPYEKVWIPEDQIKGAINKFDYTTFAKVNECFLNGFKNIIEQETCLQELELVAVRRNTLKKNDFVSMHSDFEGYVIIINIPEPSNPEEDNDENNNVNYINSKRTFEGGNILFTKDNGEIVEIELKPDELFVAKCTNSHGVQKVLSGTRESIALFSRPKI